MNFVTSSQSQGFSTTAWQALERAAVKRRSAATVLRLLSRLVQPGMPSAAARTQDLACTLPPRATCDTLVPVIDGPFEQWAALTDAYAEQFLRMQRGEKGAREKVMSLAQQMRRMSESMKCLA